MNKKITFRGMLQIGTRDQLRLKTLKGKVGYQVTKLQTINNRPGAQDSTSITTLYKKAGSIDDGEERIDLSNPNVVAVSYQKNGDGTTETDATTIIADPMVFNQDLFITAGNPDGGSEPINYYIEIESKPLSDREATLLTLQSLRTVTSR